MFTSAPPVAAATLPTRYGAFRLDVFRDPAGLETLVLVAGTPVDDCLVRLHSECATGDLLGSLRCDCRDQLEASLQKISAAGCGLFVYVRGHEGRGIGLVEKIKAYALQEKGMDTVDANVHLGFEPDQRSYDTAIGIVKQYGLSRLRLLTNNPRKIAALEKAGLIVTAREPLWTVQNPHNQKYLATKKARLGHKE